jgi:oligopeptide/dipeptide ABC transporter ATP-binding protein
MSELTQQPKPALFSLNKVSKIFGSKNNPTYALDDMTFSVEQNFPHTIAVAGESGSGKTTLMMLILGFYTPTFGQVLFEGKDIWKLKGEEMHYFRRNAQAIFQDPFAVYNPFYKVDNLLSIPIKNFKLAKRPAEARELMENALRRVGLRPEETLGRYPHQMSGGQRQRIAIARALILQPKLLVADEPVSMVDASLRATILQEIHELNKDLGIPILYITHDLTTAYHVSDYIMVLYHGSVMEAGHVENVIKEPKHPYTQLLVNSIPWPDPEHRWGEAAEGSSKGRTITLKTGCKFANRCPKLFDACAASRPSLFHANGNSQHVAACFLYQDNPVMENNDLGQLLREQ